MRRSIVDIIWEFVQEMEQKYKALKREGLDSWRASAKMSMEGENIYVYKGKGCSWKILYVPTIAPLSRPYRSGVREDREIIIVSEKLVVNKHDYYNCLRDLLEEFKRKLGRYGIGMNIYCNENEETVNLTLVIEIYSAGLLASIKNYSSKLEKTFDELDSTISAYRISGIYK